MALASLLDEALEAWQYVRTGVLREIENLSPADLAFRPHPDSRTVTEIAFHIAQSGAMMAGELTNPDGDFTRKHYLQILKEHSRGVRPMRRKSEIVRQLKRTHADGARKIRAAGEMRMLQLIAQFDGERRSRLTWMHHGIAHEEYHRGQIALYARLRGRVPALTQLIYGKT